MKPSTTTASLCLIAMTATSQATAATTKKPNVLFILMDDLGWSDLGCFGSEYYHTPNIDNLAQQGMRFTSAYAMPTSSPSRASLMSGKNPVNTGVYTVDAYAHTPEYMRRLKTPKLEKYLTPDDFTMGEMFKAMGYATANFGKWHLGDRPETYPLQQGFDVNIGGCEAGAPASYFYPYRNLKNVEPQEEGKYITEVLMDGALDFIDDHKESPFFLYFPFFEVHVPTHAKREWVEKFKNSEGVGGQNVPEYAAMLAYADHCIGQLLDKLDELGLTDNTLVILTSDNGGQILVTDNSPLRGQKGNLYEGGVRVPMVAKWNGVIDPATTNDTPIRVEDYFPTLAEVIGYEGSELSGLDGVSIMPLLKGRDRAFNRDAIYWHLPCYNGNGNSNSHLWQAPGGSIREGEWKLIQSFESGEVELYNLDSDISESNNLANKHPKITAKLLKKLKRWQEEVGAPIPSEINPKFNATKRGEPWADANRRIVSQQNILVR